MDEIEILRGAKVRVTTNAVEVDGEVTPVASIVDAVLVEADHRIRFGPMFLFILGPTIGVALYLTAGWAIPSLLAAVGIMALGGLVYRNSWLHEVNARLVSGASINLYRTQRLADARLFHVAVQKAQQMTTYAP